MLKIIQISSRLSNWEVGNSRGHEYLVNLPINLKDLLFNNQKDVHFTDKRQKDQSFLLTYFSNRDWVKKLRQYYNKYHIQGGDEIVLERRIYDDGEEEYFIDFLKNENIVFQKKSFYDEEKDQRVIGFERLKGDLDSFNEKYGDYISIILMGNFLRKKPSREDEERYYYECFDIKKDGESLLNKYSNNDMVEIKVYNDKPDVNFVNSVVICQMEV